MLLYRFPWHSERSWWLDMRALLLHLLTRDGLCVSEDQESLY